MTTSIAELFETMAWGPAPEGEEPALEWLGRHGRQFGHLIADEWRASDDGQTFEVNNPANGQVLARVAQGTRGDVDRAVQAARAAFGAWSQTPGHLRARY